MKSTKHLSDEALDAVSVANLMLTAFEKIGVNYLQVTLISDSNNIGFSKPLPPHQIRRKLPTWLSVHSHESLILSPGPPEDGNTLIVQLDDLPAATVRQIRSFVFCETETSSENYQVFIAISDGNHYDTKEIRRRLIAVTKADSGASGAFRIAGSFNAKEKHRRADGSYPRVRLIWVNHGHTVTVEELNTAGLLPPVPRAARRRAVNPTVPSPASKRRSIGSRIARRVPRYDKALAAAPLRDDGSPDRSKADLFYARTCLFYWRPPLSREEVAELLLRHSKKAQEHSDPEWYVESTIDAAIELYS
jgi:hypothetical protein